MVSQYKISISQDKRRKTKNGLYPVRLRVYSGVLKQQKLYPLELECTESEFNKIWNSKNPKGEYEDYKDQLDEIVKEAKKIARNLATFTFEEFEKQMFGVYDTEKNTINFWYAIKIGECNKNNRISTGLTYEYSLKSLIEFHEKETIRFDEITEQWLNEYQTYILDLGGSLSTIGIHLRNLRAIFNRAIEADIVNRTIYPFGKRKYNIPNPKNFKRALNAAQLKILWESEPRTEEQKKAKAFWFFSYLCNGMNTIDIANLKCKNIVDNVLHFSRIKTERTNANQLPIIITLHQYCNAIISEYGKKNGSQNDYVFRVIDNGDTVKQAHRKVKNFNRFLNQNLKKLCEQIGVPSEISMYWARHTFATTAIRKGATMEYAMEALGHTDLKTTMNYFSGFENESKIQITQRLLEFG